VLGVTTLGYRAPFRSAHIEIPLARTRALQRSVNEPSLPPSCFSPRWVAHFCRIIFSFLSLSLSCHFGIDFFLDGETPRINYALGDA